MALKNIAPTMYLSSPPDPLFASVCEGMPVLLCFGHYKEWMRAHQATFKSILIDSGAFSENSTGKKVDIEAYKDWSKKWIDHAEAIAGLDDIAGDWKRSLKNYEFIPWSFPTWHDTDPIELIKDLVPIALERKTWIGIGLEKVERKDREKLIREVLSYIPDEIHVHGWAMRHYSFIRRFDSFDSTSWWRNAMVLRPKMPWLHLGECAEIIIKKYQRETRMFDIKDNPQSNLLDLIKETEEL